MYEPSFYITTRSLKEKQYRKCFPIDSYDLYTQPHKQNTRLTLRRKDLAITSGSWAVIPPEEIAPSSRVEFAAISRILFGGVSGKLVYQLASNPTHSVLIVKYLILTLQITLEFYNPAFGSSYFAASSPDPLLSTSCDSQRGNQAIVTYKLEPSTSSRPSNARTNFSLYVWH